MQPVTTFKHDREGGNLIGILPYLLNLLKNKAMNNDNKTIRELALEWWDKISERAKILSIAVELNIDSKRAYRVWNDCQGQITDAKIVEIYQNQHPTETESKKDFDKEVEELKEQLNGATIEDVKKWKEDSLDLHSLRMSLNESSLNKYFDKYKERKFHDKVILSILEIDEKKSQLEEQNKELREALEMVYKRLHIFGESNVWEDEDEMALHRAQKALTQ